MTDDDILVSEFGNEEVPEWVLRKFDSRTHLPNGPLERLPIPLEGQLVNAVAQANHWSVMISCREAINHVIAFYEDFLPLSGYEIIASGSKSGAISSSHRLEVLILRRDEHLGELRAKVAASPLHTSVEVEMAREDKVKHWQLADADEVQSRLGIVWRLAP